MKPRKCEPSVLQSGVDMATLVMMLLQSRTDVGVPRWRFLEAMPQNGARPATTSGTIAVACFVVTSPLGSHTRTDDDELVSTQSRQRVL
jgi:hypothetical protein